MICPECFVNHPQNTAHFSERKRRLELVEDKILDFVGTYGVVEGCAGDNHEIQLNYKTENLLAFFQELEKILG